jgi:hypothetical protein
LIDCLLPLAHSPWVYIHNSTPIFLQLFKSTSISLQLDFLLQRLYLVNFIYLNSSLISIRILPWLGLQSWTLSWLNFSLNSVFKLNRILWSFYWLRLLDLNQHKLLIFILLGLDLNRVLYLGIFLVSDSFRSLFQLGLTLLIWLGFNFVSLLNWSRINLMFPCTQRSLTRCKEVPLSCTLLSCLASLPESLPGRVTPYPISYPYAYPDSYPRFCLIHYPSRYPEPHPSRYPSRTQSFSRVLPGHVPDRVNPALPQRLPSRVKSYPIVYPALPEAYPAE